MTEVQVTVDINRQADDVFAFLADMKNNPRWQRGQQTCRWTSEPPLRLGSTYDQRARFLGRDIVSSFTVTEFEPGRRIRIGTTGGTMPIDVVRFVDSLSDDTCRVGAVVAGQPPMPMRLLGPLLDRMVRRSVEGDYRRLKALLEST